MSEFNLEDMVTAAKSRVSYAIAANVVWQHKKVAEEFARLKEEKNRQTAEAYIFYNRLLGNCQIASSLQNMLSQQNQYAMAASQHGIAQYGLGGLASALGVVNAWR